MQGEPTVGLYVHVPFCERICPYCDFAVVAARRLGPEREDRYIDALLAELERRAPDFAGHSLASLYLGGGTPSLLRPESVRRVIEEAQRHFAPLAPVEITLEVNPSSVERERLPAFRAAGVGRLSIGIQSFDDTRLQRLGRAHKAEEGRRTLAAARAAGFDNVSLDLLFAGPAPQAEPGGEASEVLLDRDLDATLEFGPEHVSAYELTLEAGTPFAAAAQAGVLRLPDEETAAALIERVEERLTAAGYERYEISSYARPGFRAVHNQRYWLRAPVLGIGMGAWSSEPPSPGAPHGVRRANSRQLETYLERVESGRSPAGEPEPLTPAIARGEAVFLSLRRREGLAAAGFAAEFGAPPRHFFAPAIEALTEAHLLTESTDGDLTLTARGRMLSDSVFAHFV
ncbi:MAG: radical SAM family heme chaperone HemW [Proteobacteria bacterium]|nr:radical SAM family heme chaperone HemW [Pseudomonadota bacterium]